MICDVSDVIDASRFRQGAAPAHRILCIGESYRAGTGPKYSAVWPSECDCHCSEPACPGCEYARLQPEWSQLPSSSFGTSQRLHPPTRRLHCVMVNHWLIPANPRERAQAYGIRVRQLAFHVLIRNLLVGRSGMGNFADAVVSKTFGIVPDNLDEVRMLVTR